MQTNKKIIFNYLPPALPHTPSMALTSLQTFLSQQNIKSEIIYWNMLFHEYTKTTDIYDDSENILIPFFGLISKKYKDKKTRKKIIQLLKSIDKTNTKRNFDYYEKLLTWKEDNCLRIITEELAKIDFKEIALVGFSAKFEQWIPATIMAEEIKKRSAETKIVIGGFTNKDNALGIFNRSNYFDFCIWGEGDYPLLELHNAITNESFNIENIPRLIYKIDEKAIISSHTASKFVDFENYIAPNFDEFYKAIKKNNISPYWLTINTSKGCRWAQCKFCCQYNGYKYRERSTENIIREIENQSKKYQKYIFEFCDSNTIGKNIKHFENLLDQLIQSSLKNNIRYHLRAGIIPFNLTEELIKKMALAGFDSVHVGYEAHSDSLLKKMDKSTRFAHNILFLKFALKYGIQINGSSIIMGTPNETKIEVKESSKNLHFLRFWINERNKFHENRFGLYKRSRYYLALTEEQKETWNYTVFAELLPTKFIESENRFDIFGYYQSELENEQEWDEYKTIFNKYIVADFSYRLIKHRDIYYFDEIKNEKLINTIRFEDKLHIEIFKLINSRVIGIVELTALLKKQFTTINSKLVKEVLIELKEEYIIYCSADFSEIVGIIDFQ